MSSTSSDDEQALRRKRRLDRNPLIWLSAINTKVLAKCEGEALKYSAIGATLLVPFLFGMMAAAYAVSTLTESLFIIAGFALVWGFIIITIDRALLATYKAHASGVSKLMQFMLRATVAILMGLTVSHPLTLLLFNGEINSEIEKNRVVEMADARSGSDAARQALDELIAQKNAGLQALQSEYRNVVSAGFLENPIPAGTEAPASSRNRSQFGDIDSQIDELKQERTSVQGRLSDAEYRYEEEIRGERSGRSGIGPLARSIENDEIVPLRAERLRLSNLIGGLTKQRNDISSKLLADSAAANAEIEAQRRLLEQQKLRLFASQQGQLSEGIKMQIDSANAELAQLRNEAKQMVVDSGERVEALKEERRLGIMTRTIVLHHLFKKEGGGFAMAVYVIIAALFTLIDTIPLVIKFFSTRGQYDFLCEIEERDSHASAIKTPENLRGTSLESLQDELVFLHAREKMQFELKAKRIEFSDELGKLEAKSRARQIGYGDLARSSDPQAIESEFALVDSDDFFVRIRSEKNPVHSGDSPEHYLALDFTPEQALSTAKWLYQQAQRCENNGSTILEQTKGRDPKEVPGFTMWGAFWKNEKRGWFCNGSNAKARAHLGHGIPSEVDSVDPAPKIVAIDKVEIAQLEVPVAPEPIMAKNQKLVQGKALSQTANKHSQPIAVNSIVTPPETTEVILEAAGSHKQGRLFNSAGGHEEAIALDSTVIDLREIEDEPRQLAARGFGDTVGLAKQSGGKS